MRANYKELTSLCKKWFRLGLGSMRLIFIRSMGALIVSLYILTKITKGRLLVYFV